MLHEALKQVRLFHKFKQFELANELGISKSYLCEIESNQKPVSIELLGRYSKIFSIPVSSLMIFSENLEDKSRGKRIKHKFARKVIEIMEWFNDKEEA